MGTESWSPERWARVMMARALVVAAGVVLGGCALGLGAGVGVSMDTRGTVYILASVEVAPMGMRVAQDRLVDREYETAAYLLPVQFQGGVALNPGAGVLIVDLPGVGFTYDRTQSPHGMALSLNVRSKFDWPFDGGKSSLGWGGVLRGSYLAHLSSKRSAPHRDEWPEGWQFHGLGPSLDVAVMHDDGGWYGLFTLGARYQFLTYFMMGL